MIRIACLLLLVSAVATAEPHRVLVADRDPELVRAIEKSLAPWRLVVVADEAVPDEAHALLRADTARAQFIVWRDGDQLVVFDREHGTTERRPARAGAFDPVSAAAAALTVKTMLRLPPLEPAVGASAAPPIVAPVTEDPGPELRLQIGGGGRVARGSQTDLGARATIAAMVRPWSARGFRIGVTGDLGTSADISKAGFKGTWRDWAVLGLVSWSTDTEPEVEPWIGAGISRSVFDGTSSQGTQREAATLPTFRGGATVRWPVGRWSVGASVGVDATVGTPTYTKMMGMGNPTTIFEVPAFAMVLGIFAAADLGR